MNVMQINYGATGASTAVDALGDARYAGARVRQKA